MATVNPTVQKPQASFSGKIFLTLFALMFLGMGLLFTGFFLKLAQVHYASRSWEKTPCVITESRVDTVSGGYAASFAYAYHWRGKIYYSRQLKPGGPDVEKNVSKADAVAAQYPEGAKTVCFVNPVNPAEAVLMRGSLLFGLMALFPMVFVVIGGGLFYGIWFYAPKTQISGPRTISLTAQAARRKTQKRLLSGFFLLFFFAGLGVGYFLILPGILKSLDSKNWAETPCAILESRVQSHSGDDGTTYSIDILYAYEYAGRKYRSSQYEFISGSSSGYDAKAEVVKRHPAGAKTVCYVNPKNPGEAVLKRELGAKAFLALFPLAFMLVGLTGAIAASRNKTDNYGRRSNGSPMTASSSLIPRINGQAVLKPKTSTAGKIVASVVVSVFWNGIVSVFVHDVFQGWRAGHPDYVLTVFLIPFVLIGLALIGSIFYFFLASLNPRPVLTLLTNPLRLGDKARIQWTTSGNVYKIQNFTLTLAGDESARYRQGKDTRTESHQFYNQTLVNSAQPEHLRKGETAFQIPTASMHSFKSAHNAIVWKLTLHCDAPMWPDLKEEFEINVLPLEMESRRK